METTLAEHLLQQDIQVRCVDGTVYEGKLIAVNSNVATLEWENKTTYVACEKIVAAWRREPGQTLTPNIGFLGTP